MPTYHKYKQKAIDWVREQTEIGYRAIIVAKYDYDRWGKRILRDIYAYRL